MSVLYDVNASPVLTNWIFKLIGTWLGLAGSRGAWQIISGWRHYQVDVDDEVVLLPDHALLALHLPHADRGDARPGRPSAASRLLQRVLMRISQRRRTGYISYDAHCRSVAASCDGNIPQGASHSSNCQESSLTNYWKCIVWEKV